jgi:ribonuclease E
MYATSVSKDGHTASLMLVSLTSGIKPFSTEEENVAPIGVVESKPVESKPIESKPIESKPIESKPIESKPIESKPIESKPIESTGIDGG